MKTNYDEFQMGAVESRYSKFRQLNCVQAEVYPTLTVLGGGASGSELMKGRDAAVLSCALRT